MTSQCVSPSPGSNKHAKPFRNITPPMGDTVIAADIWGEKGGFRFAKARLQSEEKQTAVSKWGMGVRGVGGGYVTFSCKDISRSGPAGRRRMGGACVEGNKV